MISYELAKELKDVGFKKPTEPFGWYYDGQSPYSVAGSNKGFIRDSEEYYLSPVDLTYIPTLEELIEALGDDFIQLEKEGDKFEAMGKYYCCDEHGEGRKFGQGKTPSEAVAKLWIKIKKEERAG